MGMTEMRIPKRKFTRFCEGMKKDEREDTVKNDIWFLFQLELLLPFSELGNARTRPGLSGREIELIDALFWTCLNTFSKISV